MPTPFAVHSPNCGALLSETAVLANAPVCGHCGAVIAKLGGSLGVTGVYGLSDPDLTRKRIQVDLKILLDHLSKLNGMLEANKEQLNWGVERYATLPNPPQLLELQPVPRFSDKFAELAPILIFPLGLVACVIAVFPPAALFLLFVFAYPTQILGGLLALHGILAMVIVIASLCSIGKISIANGDGPLENARRKKAFDDDVEAALKAVEPIKAAQDHRLRLQIRKLEGEIKTVSEKADYVRGLQQ